MNKLDRVVQFTNKLCYLGPSSFKDVDCERERDGIYSSRVLEE